MRAVFRFSTCRALLFTTLICMMPFTVLAEGEIETETAVEAIIGDAIRGQAIYANTCKHCHTLTYDESAVGAPGLQGVTERYDLAWLDQWIKGPEAFAKVNIAAKDLISSNQSGLIMPTLPAMQDEQKRTDMLEFLKTLK
ncbi:MAG: cytochrome c [Mariprofundaceae bacterium]|nr:cytochrome c [Mariprofundaceae bacterium]